MAVYLGVTNNGTFISSDGYKLQDSNGSLLTATPSSDKLKIILNNIVYNVNVNLIKKEAE